MHIARTYLNEHLIITAIHFLQRIGMPNASRKSYFFVLRSIQRGINVQTEIRSSLYHLVPNVDLHGYTKYYSGSKIVRV